VGCLCVCGWGGGLVIGVVSLAWCWGLSLVASGSGAAGSVVS